MSHFPPKRHSRLPDLRKENEGDMYSVLWDFAGESVYHETHTLFLTSRAIFPLAYDSSLNPYENALPVKRRGMFRVIEDRIGTKTNLDYLHYWMTSLSSLCTQGKGYEVHSTSTSAVFLKTLPPVFLGCKNANRPAGGKYLKDLGLEVYRELRGESYSTQLCGPFEVDNTKSGQKPECPGVSRLRESISEVAKELPQMKEYIPIKWLKFEKRSKTF